MGARPMSQRSVGKRILENRAFFRVAQVVCDSERLEAVLTGTDWNWKPYLQVFFRGRRPKQTLLPPQLTIEDLSFVGEWEESSSARRRGSRMTTLESSIEEIVS